MIIEMNQSARFRTGSGMCWSRIPRDIRRWARQGSAIFGAT